MTTAHPPVDLRSDTVTRPTAAMRAAMANAPVGDDVFGEDPTVRALEERTALLLGKPAALFCASGSMCNQIAVQLHARAGDEVILHELAHPAHHEGAGAAAWAGAQLRSLPGPDGRFTAAQVHAAVRTPTNWHPRSRLLMVENTHNLAGGTVWPLEELVAVTDAARDHGLAVHLDGARLWNACAASGLAPDRYAAHADTVSVCFSKGLGAPIGSCLAGDDATIREARRIRHRLGGGWRQAGVLAAAARHALEYHRERLVEDHANARALADGLRGLPGLRLPERVETNIVFIGISGGDALPPDRNDAPQLQRRLAEHGALLIALEPRRLRAVTHLDVDRAGVERAIAAFRAVLGA